MAAEDLDSLLDLLVELQCLDRVPRMGYRLRGVPEGESVAEHNWHLVFLVWALASRVEGVDRLRAMELALVHDLAEVRLGDLPMPAGRHFPEGSKQRAEEDVLAELAQPLPPGAHDLLVEFHAEATPEARFVAACDKLQVMIKVSAYESWGATNLGEFWDNPDNFPDGGFELIRDLYAAIRRRRGLSAQGS